MSVVVGSSLSRPLKCRQIDQSFIKCVVTGSGGSTPVISGDDVKVFGAASRASLGVYTINLKAGAAAHRALIPTAIIPITAGVSISVSAVTVSSISVACARLSAVSAAVTIQNVVYTSRAGGTGGNSLTVAYTTGATAGSEVVSVAGNALSVQIETGVSTATQVVAAIKASAGANALVTVATTGTASTPQTAPVSPTALVGGLSVGGAVDADFYLSLVWPGSKTVF